MTRTPTEIVPSKIFTNIRARLSIIVDAISIARDSKTFEARVLARNATRRGSRTHRYPTLSTFNVSTVPRSRYGDVARYPSTKKTMGDRSEDLSKNRRSKTRAVRKWTWTAKIEKRVWRVRDEGDARAKRAKQTQLACQKPLRLNRGSDYLRVARIRVASQAIPHYQDGSNATYEWKYSPIGRLR